MASDCVDLAPAADSEPFTAGPNRGWVEVYPDGVFAQVVVGGTVIEAESDLSAEALTRVLGQLRPLDLTVEPVPIPGLTSSGGTPA